MDSNLQLLIDDLITMIQSGSDSHDDFLRLQHHYRKPQAEQPFFTKSEILAQLSAHPAWPSLEPRQQRALHSLLRVKPIRTASGVATVTSLTKPWPCPGQCIFCPADIRMPKSYLANEPGAQRAEANYFDPYLQVTNRLESLAAMGHTLAKVEIIILGGTWDAYPEKYQLWFIAEVFRALNDFGTHQERAAVREHFYQDLGQRLHARELTLSNQASINAARTQTAQKQINSGQISYNQLVTQEFLASKREQQLQTLQTDTWETLAVLQEENSHACHRNVGLVIETRPDEITSLRAQNYRRLGCTKIQIGVQSVNDRLLTANGRFVTTAQITRAFAILRLYGFKIHAHFMANLYGATPESDIEDFAEFVTNPNYLPDEIKLYPCALLANAPLMNYYKQGQWQPYTHDQLLQVLSANMRAVPAYMRISRMIRDFSATDIVAGNKKTNFRQLVDQKLQKQGSKSLDIRSREIKNQKIDADSLRLDEVVYDTSISREHFLQFVTPTNKIVGFLRLSLPQPQKVKNIFPNHHDDWRLLDQTAMIREVHVYGVVAGLDAHTNSQHLGLGKKLIARAQAIAKKHGYQKIRVISAVGTREYYAARGFKQVGYYQEKGL